MKKKAVVSLDIPDICPRGVAGHGNKEDVEGAVVALHLQFPGISVANLETEPVGVVLAGGDGEGAGGCSALDKDVCATAEGDSGVLLKEGVARRWAVGVVHLDDSGGAVSRENKSPVSQSHLWEFLPSVFAREYVTVYVANNAECGVVDDIPRGRQSVFEIGNKSDQFAGVCPSNAGLIGLPGDHSSELGSVAVRDGGPCWWRRGGGGRRGGGLLLHIDPRGAVGGGDIEDVEAVAVALEHECAGVGHFHLETEAIGVSVVDGEGAARALDEDVGVGGTTDEKCSVLAKDRVARGWAVGGDLCDDICLIVWVWAEREGDLPVSYTQHSDRRASVSSIG